MSGAAMILYLSLNNRLIRGDTLILSGRSGYHHYYLGGS